MPVKFLMGVLCVFGADRLLKALALRHLPLNTPQPLWDPVIYLTRIQNNGAAFGILQQQRWWLVAAGLIVLAVFWRFRHELLAAPLGYAGSVFLIGGDVGNLFDRFLYGGVIDFIDFRVWPIFNLADMCINLGLGLLLWEFWVRRRHVA
jgi:signal peptidase II